MNAMAESRKPTLAIGSRPSGPSQRPGKGSLGEYARRTTGRGESSSNAMTHGGRRRSSGLPTGKKPRHPKLHCKGARIAGDGFLAKPVLKTHSL